MLSILKAYFSRLNDLHDNLKKIIEGLPQQALDWTPGEDMSSLGVLMAHVAGSERYWIGDIAGQDPSGRIREEEFRTYDLSAEQLSARLDTALEHSRGVLENMTLVDLESPRVVPHDGRTISTAWALTHSLEHTALHLGHAQLTRQLWNAKAGSV